MEREIDKVKIIPPEIMPRLGWALFLRVIAVTMLLGGTAILQLRETSNYFTVSLVSIYTIIAITYVFSALSGIILRWTTNYKPFAYIQVVYDILLVTALIAVTGRIFSFLYILAILSASMILFRPGAIVAAWLSSLSYAALLSGVNKYDPIFRFVNRDFILDVRTLKTPELIYNVAFDSLAFFVVAIMASYLTEKLRHTGLQLAEKEEDLQDLEALSDNVIRNLPLGLITTDRDWKITSLNTAAEFIAGHAAAEMAGAEIHALFPTLDREKRSMEIAFTDKFEKKRSLELSLSVLKNGKGEETGNIVIFQDKTLYREMEEQLKISDRLATVGQMVAGLAHEIRNPLASISGSIQLLRRDATANTDDRILKILLRETQRLDSLITEFLHFAHPTAGQIRKVDLAKLIGEQVELFKHQCLENGALKISFGCDGDCVAHLDAKLLHQIIWNLLRNAVEAMPDGGEVFVKTEPISRMFDGKKESRGMKIEISDTGPGISNELKDKIFAPFFTTKEYGTGLGLATVYRSVESMGGRIKLNSVEGRGASFTIELPDRELEFESES